ncbi:MAG TPA: glycosyltransferase [Alphaproteobacteria bacterium]|nr:glycosyltransferase [Alphaproteobacteria bacterium]
MLKIVLLGSARSIHTRRWIKELSRIGYEVHLISAHRASGTFNNGEEVYELPISPPLGYFGNYFVVKRFLRRIRPNVLHAHYASGYGTLGRLMNFHPYILSVWGSDIYEFPYRSYLHYKILKSNLLAADCVCSTSWAMARRIRELYPETRRVSVVPFGVDTEMFAPRRSPNGNSSIVIGTVKAIAHHYGIDILIKAFAEARRTLAPCSPELASRVRLVIVGDGPDRNSLQRLVKKMRLSDVVEFTGFLPHTEIPKRLQDLDIYVATSRRESFGVAVLEASASGLPVIASNVGGLSEIVLHEQTGLIVAAEDVKETSNALLRLILDPDLRVRLGQAGRKYVMSQYKWALNAREMGTIYRCLSRIY